MTARPLAAALLLVAALAASGGAAAAAEDVRVRGGVHPDYGRLVFDWQTPVGYGARLAGDRLTVTFDRPAQFDLTDAERHLFRYLDGAEAGPDGRSLTLDLKRGYGLKGFTLGPKVVLDLLHGGAGGTAGAAPPPQAPPAQETPAQETPPQAAPRQPAQAEAAPTPAPTPVPAPTPAPATTASAAPAAELPPEIAVRVGEHADFERLVFDWPAAVDFETRTEGAGATVLFGRPARLDVSALRADPPSLLRRFADRRIDGRLQVDLGLAPGTQLRAFADGPRVVIDLLKPADAPETAGAEPNPAPPTDLTPPARQATADASAPPEPDARPDEGAPTQLVPRSQLEGEQAAQPEVQPEVQPSGRQPAEPQATEPEPQVAEAAPNAQEPATRNSAAETPAAEEPAAREAAAEGPAAFVTREEVSEREGRPVPGTAAPDTPTVLLRFAWPAETGAVGLRRGADLLLGFDAEPPVDLVAALGETAPELGAVERMAVDGGVLLRFAETPLTAIRLWRAEPGWLVEFRRAGVQAIGGPPVVVSQTGETTSVRVAVDFPERRMILDDPAGGGELVLVPLPKEGQGMGEGRDFPAFRLLPTAQGLAVLPRLEPLEISLAEDGMTLAAPAGTVSTDVADAAARAPLDGTAPPRLFDLPAWRQGTLADFNRRRQELQRAVVEAEPGESGIARLDLARFYFAHGLGSEALGVLSLMQRENDELRDDPEILLLRAASRLLVGDHARAQELLGEPALLEEPEADLWRAALAAEAQDWPAAAALFARRHPMIADYARPIRARLGLTAAEATLEAGDPGATAQRLEEVQDDVVTDLEEARYDFLRALLLQAEGDTEAAEPILRRLATAGLGAPSVQARLAMIERDLETGGLPPQEAIEQLEQLRFAWRGDAFEFALLQRLAGLYEREGRWREALRALRQAATYFPGSARAEAAAERLSALFARVFLGPDKPDLPPLTALSLYEEFRELTPPGAPGNRLIEGLADRLVAVDLLDRAAELLNGQVQFRLQGEEKARVGARLALIRLLDRQPRAALEALEVSAQDGLPDALQRQRRHLQARALSDLGRAGQALVLLQGDGSLDAQRLRAEILWAERDWAAAATALAASLPPRPDDGALPAELSGQVLNLAVAHTLAGDRPALEALRAEWGAAMSAGPHAEAFALLAEDLDPDSVATIAQQLAQVDRVQAFMASYRERLRETQLSDLN